MISELEQLQAQLQELQTQVALLQERLAREQAFTAELLDINYNLVWDNQELTEQVARWTFAATCPQFHRN